MKPGDLIKLWSQIDSFASIWAWDPDGWSCNLASGQIGVLVSIGDDDRPLDESEIAYSTICRVLVAGHLLDVHARNIRVIS
jgi:hypothetical protein